MLINARKSKRHNFDHWAEKGVPCHEMRSANTATPCHETLSAKVTSNSHEGSPVGASCVKSRSTACPESLGDLRSQPGGCCRCLHDASSRSACTQAMTNHQVLITSLIQQVLITSLIQCANSTSSHHESDSLTLNYPTVQHARDGVCLRCPPT